MSPRPTTAETDHPEPDREFLDAMQRELELLSAALKPSPEDTAPEPIRIAS